MIARLYTLTGQSTLRMLSDDELRETGIDLRYEIRDEVDQFEYPSALNFLPPDTFKEVLEQTPPKLAEICVAFPKAEILARDGRVGATRWSKTSCLWHNLHHLLLHMSI